MLINVASLLLTNTESTVQLFRTGQEPELFATTFMTLYHHMLNELSITPSYYSVPPLSNTEQALIPVVLRLDLVISIVRITLFFVMKNSSRKGLEVFDFNEQDEVLESSAKRYCRNFGNPKSDDSHVTKYTFLQCFAGGTNHQKTETSEVSCIYVDSSNSDHKCKNYMLQTLRRISADTEELKVCSRKIEASSLGAPSTDEEQSNCILLELPSESDLVDVITDDDKSVQARLLLTPDDVGENEGSLKDSASDHYCSGSETENIDLPVFVNPDHLEYGDNYCTESSLIFSCSGIKLECKNTYGDKESFSSEWAFTEIINIETQWFARVETALIKLYIKPGAEIEHENLKGTSGILEVKFAVFDPDWSGKQERIMSMDAKFNATWKLVLDNDSREEGFIRKNHMNPPKAYFPNFDQPFEDVVYPKGDPDAVSISKRDVELLQPETFINDTIIDFYIKYLKNKIQQEDRQRFHFFNSFFFRKLADMDKDPSSASQGRAAFQRVRKWTRKVNLFEKDYIFIPVNFNLHWSLMVICHPGEVANYEGEDVKKSLKVPCILHMDSIKGTHKGLKNLIQSYLWEEWKERKPESSEEISSKILNLRFVSLELPQQENSFDCGLFLLHYVELFLEEAPVYFNPFKITKFSNFLNMDWFPPVEASLKRALIQKLIYDLLEDSYMIRNADLPKVEHQFSGFTENENGKENRVELRTENRMQAKACHGNTSCSTSSQGIEIELLRTSTGAAHCFRNPGLGFRELLDQGTSDGSNCNGQSGPSDQLGHFHRFKSVASPMQEDTDNGDELDFSSPGGAGAQVLDGVTTGSCSTSLSTKGLGIFDSFWNPRNSMLDEKQEAEDASTDSSSFDSQSTSEIGEDELLPIGDSLHSGNSLEAEKPRSVSPENVWCITGSPASASSSEKLEAYIVVDSQEENTVAESKENISDSDHEEVDLEENTNLELTGDDPTSESDEQQVTKRLRRAASAPQPDEHQATKRLRRAGSTPQQDEHQATKRLRRAGSAPFQWNCPSTTSLPKHGYS